MASIAKHLSVGESFSNEESVLRFVYDFDVDGGAAGALDIMTASSALVITHFHAVVKTTATSGGSATLAVGVTGDTDRFIKATEGAVASLTANSVFKANPELTEGTPNTILMTLPYRLAAGEKVLQTIATAALTAGKIEYVIKYVKA